MHAKSVVPEAEWASLQTSVKSKEVLSFSARPWLPPPKKKVKGKLKRLIIFTLSSWSTILHNVKSQSK
jgi:hypothetical protein